MNTFVLAKYLRLSSEDTDMKETGKAESNSIANQRNLLDTFIRNEPQFADAEVVEFCDDGWSGKNFERPAVQEMLTQVRQGKIQCIVVKDMSRFGRDYLIVGNYISRVFPFLGVRFIAVNDGIDSIRRQDVGSLETSFKTLLYDLYSRDLSRKVRSAARLRAQRGDFLSSHAPYGYQKNPDNKKQLVIDPPAAVIVRRIFQMVGAGVSAVSVARILNDEGVLTPMRYKMAADCTRKVWNCVHDENFWTNAIVTKIVRDERYIGSVVFGKRFYDIVGNRHSVKVSKSDWIVVEGMHEEIVTREEFDRAQAALREFAERNSSSSRNVLRTKVRCGICGHAMRRETGKQPYYFCRTSRLTNLYTCTTVRVLECDIMEAIMDGLHMLAQCAVEWKNVWEEQQRKSRKDNSVTRKSITAVKESIQQIDCQVKELYEAFALGEIDKRAYLSQKASMVKRRDDLEAQAASMEAQLENVDVSGNLNNRFVTSFQKYSEIEVVTQEIAEDVLKEVLVYPNGRLEIVWNYREEFEKLLLDLQKRRSEDERRSDYSMDKIAGCGA